jgi:hypothetical protein
MPVSRGPTLGESRSEARPIAALAVVLVTVMLAACACGNSNRTKAELLRSANPVTSDLYLRVKGPAGAVSYITQGAMTGAFSRIREGFFVPPRVRHHKACSFTHIIGVGDAPDLQKWRGKKTSITVYGNSSYAAIYCLGIGATLASSS